MHKQKCIYISLLFFSSFTQRQHIHSLSNSFFFHLKMYLGDLSASAPKRISCFYKNSCIVYSMETPWFVPVPVVEFWVASNSFCSGLSWKYIILHMSSVRKLPRSRIGGLKGVSVKVPAGNSTFKLGWFGEDFNQGTIYKHVNRMQANHKEEYSIWN